jgi:hypothetical protein
MAVLRGFRPPLRLAELLLQLANLLAEGGWAIPKARCCPAEMQLLGDVAQVTELDLHIQSI